MAGGASFRIELLDGDTVVAFFERLSSKIDSEKPTLFRSVGEALVSDVKNRIVTQDGGRWTPVSKWVRAKTGQDRALKGAEKYVKFQVFQNMLQITGDAKGWSLSQHDKGFVNPPIEADEKRDEGGRVTITLKDPRVLNLKASVFSFLPKRTSRTPARKIWPTQGETENITLPIASRWLAKQIADAGGNLVRT